MHVREVGAAELLCCSQGATPKAAGRPRVLSGSRWSAPRAPHPAMESARVEDGDTLLLPCAGLYAVIVGATVSTVVNWYMLPDSPPNQLPAASLTHWFDIFTVYRTPPLALGRLDDGLIVTVRPEMLT